MSRKLDRTKSTTSRGLHQPVDLCGTHFSIFGRVSLALLAMLLPLAYCSKACSSEGPARDPRRSPIADETISDTSRKADILNSVEWRRAVFELGHWLDSQNIYTATQVATIKSRFNAKVAKMSSYEVQYLLDDLREKFRVMDTPEARDARAWVGQYLSMLSENKRTEVLKQLPDVTAMTAAELTEEIQRIENRKAELTRAQSAYDRTRQEIVRSQQQSIMNTQEAATRATRSGGSYSPYHSGGAGGGKTPFSNVNTGGSVHVTTGPFGAYVSF